MLRICSCAQLRLLPFLSCHTVVACLCAHSLPARMLMSSHPFWLKFDEKHHPLSDGALLKKEAHAFQCTTTGPYHAAPIDDLLRAGSACGLGVAHCGIRILSFVTLVDRLSKIRAAREHDNAYFFALSPERQKSFFEDVHGSQHTEAFERHLDHAGRLADSPSDKRRDAKRDFSEPIAARAKIMLGPISRTPYGTNFTCDEKCSTCFSPWISRWHSSRSLQRHVYGTTRTHRW